MLKPEEPKILGHSSVVVTEQHYGHLSLADLKEAVDHIDGVVSVAVAAKLQHAAGNEARELIKTS